jgi:stage III sporulation protein AH
MKIQKKHIVLAALVLALGTAVYVNWQMSGSTPTTSKELGAASFVNATVSTNATEDEAVETAALSKTQKNYFAAERTKRQNTQDEIIDDAKEIFNLEESSDDEKSEAQESVEKLLKTFTIQDSIESIVKAKGFSDCLCYISDEGVTVIVPDTELNDTAALVIDDAVTTHYDVEYDSISIVGAN